MKKIFFIIFIFLTILGVQNQQVVLANEEQIVSFFNRNSFFLEDSSDLTPLIESAENKKVVLLGEASHGTSEYYIWRKKISRRLIKEKDFSFILVEGDWPSCFAVNLYVKGLTEQVPENEIKNLLRNSYKRWPQWMWANQEIVKLIEWLREYNEGLPLEERIGFYGMDVYSLEESVKEVKKYIREINKESLLKLKENYRCFERFNYDGFSYARAVYSYGYDCRPQIQEVSDKLKEKSSKLIQKDPYSYFNAKTNAIVVKNSERYYRSAISRGPEGWNNRVYHMESILYRLLDFYGENSRGIVWAHNTHVGDARATSMRNRNQVNIGQLAREKLGNENVFIVGFGTYTGTVVAGREWGSSLEIMTVPEAKKESIENILSQVKKESFLVLFDETARHKPYLNKVYGHRAIGVVYNPEVEHLGNYVPTILPYRYDAFIFFQNTQALNPLAKE